VSRGGAERRLSHEGYEAVVTAVGGGLRVLRHRGRDLVLSYAADQIRPRYRGTLLAPWPNRVVDGRYTFEGVSHQLDITEPERGHALHGLVCWERFELTGDTTSVTARHRLVPRTGYPFELELSATYSLDVNGLTCRVTCLNSGDHPAPYGVAGHPYLVAGPGPVDSWTLELAAAQVQEVTPDRLVPTGVAAVTGTRLDFREPRSLDGLGVDHAFTALVPGTDGLVRARVRAEDGGGVECTWDPASLPWVQVHTADLPPPEPNRAGLAVEPMTCPPDAFNSRQDLRVLAPGESTTAAWTIGTLAAGGTR
jgi:aldose 1-epimerase